MQSSVRDRDDEILNFIEAPYIIIDRIIEIQIRFSNYNTYNSKFLFPQNSVGTRYSKVSPPLALVRVIKGGQLKIPRECSLWWRRRMDEIAIKIPSRSYGIAEAATGTM